MSLLINKKAKRDYEILEKYIAGLVLSGPEVKSLRLKHGSLTGSYVKILQGETFLVNAQINPYSFATQEDYDPKRSRKLLLKKNEIVKLTELSQRKNITLVPLSIFLAGKRLKLEFGVGRGKKEFEKRDDLRRRAQTRDAQRELKHHTKIRG